MRTEISRGKDKSNQLPSVIWPNKSRNNAISRNTSCNIAAFESERYLNVAANPIAPDYDSPRALRSGRRDVNGLRFNSLEPASAVSRRSLIVGAGTTIGSSGLGNGTQRLPNLS